MKTVIKNKGKTVCAYKLGTDDGLLTELIKNGKLIPLENGDYEVMSQEAISGSTGKGQLAHTGDYIKIDSSGCPYPNTAEFFEQNHRHIEGCTYEQIPKPLKAWLFGEPMCEEILFLMQKKGLVIRPDDYDHYFTAPLFGTVESAARSAAIVFYSILRNELGGLLDIEFNFVARDVFDKTYSFIED
ncbi:MAG: hypothetical protein II072_06450 [Clostridia bacterium]|nr:hypothetical protein [Clostridia bacterium]